MPKPSSSSSSSESEDDERLKALRSIAVEGTAVISGAKKEADKRKDRADQRIRGFGSNVRVAPYAPQGGEGGEGGEGRGQGEASTRGDDGDTWRGDNQLDPISLRIAGMLNAILDRDRGPYLWPDPDPLPTPSSDESTKKKKKDKKNKASEEGPAAAPMDPPEAPPGTETKGPEGDAGGVDGHPLAEDALVGRFLHVDDDGRGVRLFRRVPVGAEVSFRIVYPVLEKKDIKRRKREDVFGGGADDDACAAVSVSGADLVAAARASGFVSAVTGSAGKKKKKQEGTVVRDGRCGDDEYGAKRHGVTDHGVYDKLLG